MTLLIVGDARAGTSPPVLLSQPNSTRAIAFEAFTYTREPFQLSYPLSWLPDNRSRIILFAKNVSILSTEDLSVLTADAQDVSGKHYALQVEHVDPVPGQEWMSAVQVRLNDRLPVDVGDVLVGLTLRGVSGNRVRIGIGHVGGGLPDDQSSYVMPYVLEFDGSPQTIDYGAFWPSNTDLGRFFWEFWAMPGVNADATYLITDGYGGAHSILFGFSRLEDLEHYSLYGNIFDGTNITVFAGDEGPTANEWGHYAVGWDGRYVITYFDGVPVGRTLFLGPRRSPGADSGGGKLLIGGSDHSNLIGRIAQLRGYEGVDLLQQLPGEGRTTAAFAPDSIFGLTSANGGDACTVLSSLMSPSQTRVVWTNNFGLTVVGNGLKKIAGTGWNAAASSTLAIGSGSGYAEFVASELGTRRLFGLNSISEQLSFTDIDYGVLLEFDGRVAVVDARTPMGYRETYVPGDRFRIEVSPGKVRFSKNGNVFYQNDATPNFPLRADGSIYHLGATIKDAVIAGSLTPLSQPEQVMDLAGGRIGRIRGVANGLGDVPNTFPLPAFVADPTAAAAVTSSGQGPLNAGPLPKPAPDDAIVFDSFSRRSSTLAFDGIGGLGSVELSNGQPSKWLVGGPNDTSDVHSLFGILNGHAVILSNQIGLAWLPLSGPDKLKVQVDRTQGAFGSGLDTGLCFRVVDSRNFFFASTGAGPDEPASKRLLTVGYFLNGIQTRLATGVPMPPSWTTLRVETDGGNIAVFADSTLVFSTVDANLAQAHGAGLYNNGPGLALTNRWDNFEVGEAQSVPMLRAR